MKPVFTCFIAFCSVWLASAARALSLKAWEVLSMASGAPPRRLFGRLAVRRLTDGGMIRHARQHLGDVAHLDVGAPPLQLARSEERRVGKECVSTGRSRGSPSH